MPPLAAILFATLLCLPAPLHAREAFFSNIFSPDSLMGAGPAARGAPTSTPPGFSDQSAYVALPPGALVALGDFNRDRFIDLVMLNTGTLRHVSLLLWNHDAFKFQFRTPAPVISLPALDAAEKAANRVPLAKLRGVHVADFSNTGSPDLLLHDGKQGRVFRGDGNGTFNTTHYHVLSELPLTHAVVDANADLVPDIFVAFPNGTRGFWVFEEAPVAEGKEAPAVEPAPQPRERVPRFYDWPGSRHRAPGGSDCVVTDAVSIAFVDMDGDCLPDLVVPTSCGLEVWSNPADSGRKFWELSANRSSSGSDLRLLGLEVYNANHGDQSLAFADFNSDGTIDIAVPNGNRKDLLIHLNRQKKRFPNALCVRDVEWDMDRRTGVSGGLNLRKLKVGPLFGGIEILPSLHIGDYDLDGLPDILVIDGSTSGPVMFQNLGLWDDKHIQEAMFRRLERKEEEGLSKGNSGAVAATFFDTDESGRQDVLVVRGGNETRLIWNNMREQTDSLFFKGTVLSGLAYRSEPRPFSPVAGNTIKLSYMERGSRQRVIRACSQCVQGGLWQLRACNCQFGLMRIANYIEELWVGAGGGRRSWSNLMPNSMAVVWGATDAGGDKGDEASAWWMEYFTQRRGSQMLRVSALLVVALFVLAVAILVLQQRERKEDREEDERERIRLFNFV